MARFTFRLPDIGEGIAQAEIVAWHKRVGERIEDSEPLADMLTDKATVELESPVSGTIVELAGEVGDRVAIGGSLAVIETAEAAAVEPVSPGPTEAPENPIEIWRSEAPTLDSPPTAHPELVEGREGAGGGGAAQSTASVPASEPDTQPSANGGGARKVLASPAVRARAKDLGVDLSQVRSAGDHIRHADLDAFLRYGSAQGYTASGASRTRPDEAIKLVGMRRRIAENMAASKQHIPHFTYVEEIDVTALEAMRAQLNDNRGDRLRLTILPFLVVAICQAVPDFPMINARFDDAAGVVTRHGEVHLGIAAQTDAGLMVPVLHSAQNLNIWQIAAEIARLAEAARSGKAAREELTGSTLTLSSLGPLGGVAATPVINWPEVAIINPGRIIERPVFVGDDIRRAKLMNLSISCDHRVIDGWDAASFVQALKRLIEAPALLFA